MITVADNELARVNDAAGCRQWLAALPEDSLERLSSIGRLLVRIGRPDLSVDTTITMLEPTRVALLRAADECLSEIAGQPLPYGAEAWRKIGDSLTTLRALRTMYKRAGSRIAREIQARVAGVEPPHGDAAGGTTLPAAATIAAASAAATNAMAAPLTMPASTAMGSPILDDASRAALPLLRALDVQSRVVATLLVHRVEPLPEDWDELCLLARHARSAGLLDAQIPEVLPIVRPVTARALFIFPLLLRLAGLTRRSRTEAALIERLASRMAGQVGLRIDGGVSKKNPYGPTLALSASSSVRLDTHRIPGALARRRQQWAEVAAGQVAAPPSQIAGEALLALIDDLHRCWAPPAAGGVPAAVGPGRLTVAAGGGMLVAFGLPRRRDADDFAGPRPHAGGAAGAPRNGATARRGAAGGYDYGEWEQNTILRVSRVPRVGEKRASTQDWDPLAGAESAQRLPDADERLLVERRQLLPSATPGGLVALRAEREETANVGESSRPSASTAVQLGTIESVAQLPEPGYSRIGVHRLGIELWPGRALVAGLKLGAANSFDDVWLLSGSADEDEAASLVVAPGLAAPGVRAILRAGEREQPMRFTELLGRGPGYERYGFVTDRADGAAARGS